MNTDLYVGLDLNDCQLQSIKGHLMAISNAIVNFGQFLELAKNT